MNYNANIYVAGHRGMVGSAIVRKLRAEGYTKIITRTHAELDLTDQQAVREFFRNEHIDYVVLAAAKVGGILANNTYPAEFIYTNLCIQCNIIHEAYEAGIEHLLFLGSSCIYPKFAPQPMREEYLLSGELEPTNEAYAVAKIAGIKMCEAYNRQYGTSYRSVMPTNLYGPRDNYHLENSHVIPAMIRKYHLAKLVMHNDLDAIKMDEKKYGPIPQDIKQAMGLSPDSSQRNQRKRPQVILWGTGEVYREFLHVDDMADACIFVMNLEQYVFNPSSKQSIITDRPNTSFLNIGSGTDLTISEIASIIQRVVGFDGETIYDATKPDGTPKKLLDTTRINTLGWQPRLTLEQGVEDAYLWYLEQLC